MTKGRICSTADEGARQGDTLRVSKSSAPPKRRRSGKLCQHPSGCKRFAQGATNLYRLWAVATNVSLMEEGVAVNTRSAPRALEVTQDSALHMEAALVATFRNVAEWLIGVLACVWAMELAENATTHYVK
ncbi:hypothetical protein FOL47_003269 [Perkinsus chesapeaki]|uniref:Uncharacterized protein n=1 Tax=Perkinsus chesapeaki TaxID=330153 RepID=A0A7J6N3S1_PERCH|nr:hypothetical protein FOL47_003269 [Perkinsus chesapeaki]